MRKRKEEAEEGLAGDPQEKALVIGAVPTGGYNAAGRKLVACTIALGNMPSLEGF